jgi:hypothetical protein
LNPACSVPRCVSPSDAPSNRLAFNHSSNFMVCHRAE